MSRTARRRSPLRALLVAALAASAVALPAAPAAATPTNPVDRCGPGDLFTIVYTNPRTGATELHTKPVASHGGCVSSWAIGTGELSRSALTAQCKRIEGILVSRYGYAYPHSFYGRYPARNRAGCTTVMHGLSTGTLDSGLPTPFPF